jgi:hypothetical protein
MDQKSPHQVVQARRDKEIEKGEIEKEVLLH